MSAPKVTVYTKQNCPFCVRAKRLLEKKGVAYEEIDVEEKDDLRIWLAETTGQKTVPQIFAGASRAGSACRRPSSGRRRWPGSRPTTGRATCASCAT